MGKIPSGLVGDMSADQCARHQPHECQKDRKQDKKRENVTADIVAQDNDCQELFYRGKQGSDGDKLEELFHVNAMTCEARLAMGTTSIVTRSNSFDVAHSLVA